MGSSISLALCIAINTKEVKYTLESMPSPACSQSDKALLPLTMTELLENVLKKGVERKDGKSARVKLTTSLLGL